MTGRPAASAFAAIFSSISAVAGSSTDGDLNEDFDIEDFDVEDLDDEDSDDEDLEDEDLEGLDEGFDGMKTDRCCTAGTAAKSRKGVEPQPRRSYAIGAR